MEENKQTYPTSTTDSAEQTQEENVVALDIIRTEVNFSALPFFSLSNKDASSRSKLEYRTALERDGQAIEALWRVVATTEYGYPTPFDRRVHKAIEHVITEKGLPVRNPILFSIYEILTVLQLSNRGGANYRKVKETIRRIVHTGIDSEGAFYSKSREQYISDSFHLYDRVVFKGSKMPDGTMAEANYLFLSDWYVSSINSLYVRPIDFQYLRSLNSNIAGRLYDLVGLKFYGVLVNKRACWRIDYGQLCDLLPIARQRYLSKAKEKLEPAHRELVKTGFLSKAEWEEVDGRDWYIRYYPGGRAIKEFCQARSKRGLAEQLSLPLERVALPKSSEDSADLIGCSKMQQAVQMLTERGITKRTAESLVRKHPDRIESKIEAFDWLVQTNSPRVRDNPPGFLRKSIEEDWQPPPGFTSKAEREEQIKQAQEQKRRREAKEREALDQARKKHVERRAESPWKALWEHMADELRKRLSPEAFSSWIEPTLIADVQGNMVVLSVPDRFFGRWIEGHYAGAIEEVLSAIRGQATGLRVVCDDAVR